MDVVIEKESSSFKVFDHDFIIHYYPESDDAKVSFKVTSGSAAFDLYAAEKKISYQNLLGLSLST